MSTTLVSIDNCTSVQVLPSQDIPLATGALQLLSVEAPESTEQPPTSHSSIAPVLTLKIGNAAFPITKSTPFYTHTSSPRIYIFAPVLADVAVGAGTYVKITLPEDISVPGSEAEIARNAFEEVLVQHGLLEEGTAAIADEIAAGAREAGLKAASSIKRAATTHTSGPPATPSTFSPTTHSIADSAVSGTAALQSYTSASRTMASVGTSIGASAGSALSKATETVAKAGVAVGERLAHMLGVEDQVERVASEDGGSKFDNADWSGAFDAPRDDDELGDPAKYGDGSEVFVKSVGKDAVEIKNGVKDGVSAVTSATWDATTTVLGHDVGPEAAELAEKSSEAASNVRKATGDALLATSAIVTVGYVATGIRDGHGPDHEPESEPVEKDKEARPAPELLEAQPIRH